MPGRKKLPDRVCPLATYKGKVRLTYWLDGKRHMEHFPSEEAAESRAKHIREIIASAKTSAPPSPISLDGRPINFCALIEAATRRVVLNPGDPEARATLRTICAAAMAHIKLKPKAPGSHEDGKGDTEEITDEELLVELERQAACCRSRLEARRDGGNGHTRPETT